MKPFILAFVLGFGIAALASQEALAGPPAGAAAVGGYTSDSGYTVTYYDTDGDGKADLAVGNRASDEEKEKKEEEKEAEKKEAADKKELVKGPSGAKYIVTGGGATVEGPVELPPPAVLGWPGMTDVPGEVDLATVEKEDPALAAMVADIDRAFFDFRAGQRAVASVDPRQLLDELKALTSKAKELAEEDVAEQFFAKHGNAGAFRPVNGGLLADVHFPEGEAASDPQLLAFKNEGDQPLELTVGFKLPPNVKPDQSHSDVSDALVESLSRAAGLAPAAGPQVASVPATIVGQSAQVTIPSQTTGIVALSFSRSEVKEAATAQALPAQTVSCPATYSVSSPETKQEIRNIRTK